MSQLRLREWKGLAQSSQELEAEPELEACPGPSSALCRVPGLLHPEKGMHEPHQTQGMNVRGHTGPKQIDPMCFLFFNISLYFWSVVGSFNCFLDLLSVHSFKNVFSALLLGLWKRGR